MEVYDGWYRDLAVVGAGGIWVVIEAKAFSADDGPGFFDEAAAYPELEGSLDEGKVLGLLLAAIGFSLVGERTDLVFLGSLKGLPRDRSCVLQMCLDVCFRVVPHEPLN